MVDTSKLTLPHVVGYVLLENIGGGGFSTVYKAFNFELQRVAACKVVSLTPQTTSQERKVLEKEIRVHSAMKHVNVLEFLNAVIVEVDGNKGGGKYFPGIYMLMELASGGDLFDKIAPDVGLEDELAQFYFNQLVAGLTYIHTQGVCHRDLKPENLLLDISGRLKISDFGLCSVFKHKESGRVRLLTDRCGSLPYVAPELSGDRPYQAEPVDVWGVGVILFTLLAGNTPWDEPSANSPEFRSYVNGSIFSVHPWNRIEGNAMSLIKSLLTLDPQNRMKLEDIPFHPWCMRPSQVAGEGCAALAQRLTQSLRTSGDMEMIDPLTTNLYNQDADGDTAMVSSTCQSQFTQSLLLFSQTQSGTRYTPHLTRFYALVPPTQLLQRIISSLNTLGVKSKLGETSSASDEEKIRLRIGGFDRRKEKFKGWVEIESFLYQGKDGSFCVMQRDQGNPISWRQLWKALVKSEEIEPYVLKRGS